MKRFARGPTLSEGGKKLFQLVNELRQKGPHVHGKGKVTQRVREEVFAIIDDLIHIPKGEDNPEYQRTLIAAIERHWDAFETLVDLQLDDPRGEIPRGIRQEKLAEILWREFIGKIALEEEATWMKMTASDQEQWLRENVEKILMALKEMEITQDYLLEMDLTQQTQELAYVHVSTTLLEIKRSVGLEGYEDLKRRVMARSYRGLWLAGGPGEDATGVFISQSVPGDDSDQGQQSPEENVCWVIGELAREGATQLGYYESDEGNEWHSLPATPKDMQVIAQVYARGLKPLCDFLRFGKYEPDPMVAGSIFAKV